MKLTETYINNKTNPRTCIWFKLNSEYFGFPFRNNKAPKQLTLAVGFSRITWNCWLEGKSIIKLTKQIGEELCN